MLTANFKISTYKTIIKGSLISLSIRLLMICSGYIFLYFINKNYGYDFVGNFALIQSIYLILSTVCVLGFDTLSVIDKLIDETNEDIIVLEDATESRKWFKSGYTSDTTATLSAIVLETTNIIVSAGQIPAENLLINSNTGGLPLVRSADIHVRDTGDIALEDETDTTHGFLILNSTSGSSTNAGENIQFEGATGITY